MESENDLHISQKEKESMILFLDIYQNTGLNETIIKNSDSYKISPKEEYKEAIDVVSPLYNESISKIFKAGNSNLRSLSLPNLNAAIRYADNYARNANPLYANYDSSGGDCTNFVSQILNAGGIGQVDTGNENTGWWYRSRNNRSISWINAQTFARYMGISGTARSFTALHSIAHVGAFIGGSTSNDGKLNHLAFVTDKNAKDLRIAQHSAFYHEWTYAGASGWKSGSSYWMIR